MNMFKKNGGFTLVELIVVIAILAILAGIAVPAYSGYIAKANNSAILSELTAIQTAAQSACALEGTTIESIKISADGTVELTPAVEDEDISENFAEFYTVDKSALKELIDKNEDAKGVGANWTAGSGWDILADSTDATDGSTGG